MRPTVASEAFEGKFRDRFQARRQPPPHPGQFRHEKCLRWGVVLGPPMFLKPRQLTLAAFVIGSSLHAAPEWKSVETFLAAKCYECHNAEKTKGDVDLKQFAADPKLAVEFDLWQKVKDSIENGDMPPKKAKALEPAEKEGITGWVTHSLDALA